MHYLTTFISFFFSDFLTLMRKWTGEIISIPCNRILSKNEKCYIFFLEFAILTRIVIRIEFFQITILRDS